MEFRPSRCSGIRKTVRESSTNGTNDANCGHPDCRDCFGTRKLCHRIQGQRFEKCARCDGRRLVTRMKPVDIQQIGDELAIKWDDGAESFVKLEKLRRRCPCAGCKGE